MAQKRFAGRERGSSRAGTGTCLNGSSSDTTPDASHSQERLTTEPYALAVYDGRTALGSVVARDATYEAITVSGKSLGRYNTLNAAANAITDEVNRRCDPGGAT